MKRDTGASISEYMLILALVVLVAVPAVAYLGSTVGAGFQNDPTTQADGLFSLIDASAPTGGGTTTVTGGQGGAPSAYAPVDPPAFIDANGNINVVYNSDGTIGFTNSDGTMTTSSQGDDWKVTEMLANMIETISVNAVDDDGNPISDTMKGMLKNMSDLASQLAQAEAAVNAGNGDVSDVVKSYLEFNKAYADLEEQAALEAGEYSWWGPSSSDPTFAALLAKVDQYGGLVSNVADANYVAGAIPKVEYTSCGWFQCSSQTVPDYGSMVETVGSDFLEKNLGIDTSGWYSDPAAELGEALNPKGEKPRVSVPVDMSPVVTQAAGSQLAAEAAAEILGPPVQAPAGTAQPL